MIFFLQRYFDENAIIFLEILIQHYSLDNSAEFHELKPQSVDLYIKWFSVFKYTLPTKNK